MAAAPDLVINRIRVPNSAGASHTWTIEYKQYLVGDYQVVATGITLNPDGTLTVPQAITGLEINTRYLVRVTDEFCGVSSVEPFAYWTDDPGQPGEWRMAAFTCEKESVFNLVSTVSGLSSPGASMYDSVSGRVWFAEFDNPAGPVGSYLPDATTAAEVTYYSAPLGTGASNFFYAHVLDPENGFIYIVGKSTQGMLAFNIATQTYTVAPFGTDNINFNRNFIQLFENRIVCIDAANARVITIDRTTFAVLTNTLITAIPSGTSCLYGSPRMQQVGDEIWVAKNNSNTGPQSPNIFRYNLDFTVLIGVIDISANCVVVNPVGVFCKDSWIYNGIYYILDAGSSKLMKIDPADPTTVMVVKTFDNRGPTFNYTSLRLIIEPITGNTFLSGNFYVSLSSSSRSDVTFRWDFVNDRPTYDYPGISFSNLTRIGATNELHGNSTGRVAWDTLNTGWETDGSILKYDV